MNRNVAQRRDESVLHSSDVHELVIYAHIQETYVKIRQALQYADRFIAAYIRMRYARFHLMEADERWRKFARADFERLMDECHDVAYDARETMRQRLQVWQVMTQRLDERIQYIAQYARPQGGLAELFREHGISELVGGRTSLPGSLLNRYRAAKANVVIHTNMTDEVAIPHGSRNWLAKTGEPLPQTLYHMVTGQNRMTALQLLRIIVDPP